MIVRRYKRGINKYEHPRNMVRKLTTMAAKLFSIFGCYYIGLYMYVRVREIPILVFSKVDLWCVED